MYSTELNTETSIFNFTQYMVTETNGGSYSILANLISF